MPCELCLSEAQSCVSVNRPLRVLETRRHVFDPPARCGAASTTLYRECGDSLHLWRSSLLESAVKMTGKLDVNLGGLAFVASQRSSDETWLPGSNTLD